MYKVDKNDIDTRPRLIDSNSVCRLYFTLILETIITWLIRLAGCRSQVKLFWLHLLLY